MYEEDLALKNQHGWSCHKPNRTKPNKYLNNYFSGDKNTLTVYPMGGGEREPSSKVMF